MITKSHYKVFFFLILTLFFLFGKAMAEDHTAKVIKGIKDRYGNKKGLTAVYSREAISKTMAILETSERHDIARGKLFFKPPNSLRLGQTSPHKELLLSNGLKIWWYLPRKKEVYIYAAEEFSRELNVLSDILKGLKDSKNHFRISLKSADHNTDCYNLFLKPEPLWQDIDHFELFVMKTDFTIKEVDIYNSIGGLTRFLFTDWKEKDQFETGFFSFSIPHDTKVITK